MSYGQTDKKITKEKKQKLLSSAYKLFTTKGIKNTSIQDIVDSAEVAKGTFYLYFLWITDKNIG